MKTLTLLVFVIRGRELQQFDLLFRNKGISVGSNRIMFFFYLLHFWIWFNIKPRISYEAVPWKLCLRHLLCPTALALLPCRWVVSPWVEVGDAFLVPHARRRILCSLQLVKNTATSLADALFNATFTLAALKSSKLSEV